MHVGIQQVTRMNVDVMSRVMVMVRDLLVGMVLDNEDGLLLLTVLSVVHVDILRLCRRPTPASAQCDIFYSASA